MSILKVGICFPRVAATIDTYKDLDRNKDADNETTQTDLEYMKVLFGVYKRESLKNVLNIQKYKNIEFKLANITA